MSVFAATTASTFLPLSAPVKTRGQSNIQNQRTNSVPVKVFMQTQSIDAQRVHFKLAVSGSATQLRPSITCATAMNARCAASGQTQTLNRKSPGVTKAPQKETNKTPRLDDGGPAFPPFRGGGGGGGGGGGEGNFSGGFFLFGFLGFLGYLKDLENEHSQETRMR